tara:strand:- start:2036 stop:2836 length:801 start_codon:yes stop_codon:yes gene_type:complete
MGDLSHYTRAIVKSRLVWLFTMLVVIITLIVSLLLPQVYESSAVIRVGIVGEEPVYSTAESKNIIQSSTILLPLLPDYVEDFDSFVEKNIEVEIIAERIAFSIVEETTLLRITVKAPSADEAKQITEDILSSFFSYAKPTYDRVMFFKMQELNETKENIAVLERKIDVLQEEIRSLEQQQLSTEGVSKALLLEDVFADYKSLTNDIKKRKGILEEVIERSKAFEVLSEPQLPSKPSQPRVLFNVVVAFIISFVLSSSVVVLHISRK